MFSFENMKELEALLSGTRGVADQVYDFHMILCFYQVMYAHFVTFRSPTNLLLDNSCP